MTEGGHWLTGDIIGDSFNGDIIIDTYRGFTTSIQPYHEVDRVFEGVIGVR